MAASTEWSRVCTSCHRSRSPTRLPVLAAARSPAPVPPSPPETSQSFGGSRRNRPPRSLVPPDCLSDSRHGQYRRQRSPGSSQPKAEPASVSRRTPRARRGTRRPTPRSTSCVQSPGTIASLRRAKRTKWLSGNRSGRAHRSTDSGRRRRPLRIRRLRRAAPRRNSRPPVSPLRRPLLEPNRAHPVVAAIRACAPATMTLRSAKVSTAVRPPRSGVILHAVKSG